MGLVSAGDYVYRGRDTYEVSLVLAAFNWNNEQWAVVDTAGAPTVTLQRYLRIAVRWKDL